jgi:hypothetical protein
VYTFKKAIKKFEVWVDVQKWGNQNYNDLHKSYVCWTTNNRRIFLLMVMLVTSTLVVHFVFFTEIDGNTMDVGEAHVIQIQSLIEAQDKHPTCATFWIFDFYGS